VRAKGEIVREQLARIGHLPDVEVRDCLPSPAPWAYRNSARMAFSSSGRPGYRAAASHTIVAVDECPILEPALQEQLGSLKRGGSSAKDVELRVAMDPIAVGEYRYHVPLGAFFQVNTAVAELLVREVLAALAPTQEDNVLDLYCGAGLFTAPIAARAGRVLGVEQGEAAIRGARLNLREWPNADALEATVESALAGDRIAGVAWNKIVLDPPRRGVEPGALEQIAALRPARIAYVSCDPATFARDAALLAQRGYRLAFAQPLDMFPQTAHVETVGLFVNP
jgi:23S rRNA (uracil1939-C5)-methyltransferase